MKYKWKASMVFSITGFDEKVSFIGREPVEIKNINLKNWLIKNLGTVETVGDNQVRFIGGASWKTPDGTLVEVDKDGFVEFDWNKFPDERKQEIEKELEAV